MSNAIIVTARPAEGRRRCGRVHPPEPVTHPAGTFTADQIAQLKADKQLVVIDAPAPAPVVAAAAEPPKPKK